MPHRATLALPALLVLLSSGPASAAPAPPPPPSVNGTVASSTTTGPVYLPVIASPEGPPAEASLQRAFRSAVTLRVPARADWRLTSPDARLCARRCTVVHIVGHRIPSPEFTLEVRRLPGNEHVASASLRVPAHTSLPLLADALLLKASFLMGVDLGGPPPPPPPPVAAPTPTAPTPRPATSTPAATVRATRPAPPSHQTRFELGVGSSVHVGGDGAYQSYGVEVSMSLRLKGPWRLRLAAGYQDAGQAEDAKVSFQVVPLSVLAGAQWSGSWWTLGVFGGGSVLLHWVRFEDGGWSGMGDLRQTALTGGPTAVGRFGVRLTRWLELGVNVRVTYLVNALRTEYYSAQWGGTRTWEVPNVLLHPSIDLAFRF